MLKTSLTAIAIIVVFASLPTPARAFIAGDGKGKAESDCFIGLEGFQQEDLQPFGNGKKKAIQCQDGDECDLDGQVNGSCRFAVAACVNAPGISNCSSTPLKKVKASAKPKGSPKVDLNRDAQGMPLPIDGGSACGAFQQIDVPIKKNGKKPGAKVTLLAKKPKDKDVFLFLCTPPSSTTTTTMPPTLCDNPSNAPTAPDEMRLTVAQTGTDLDNGFTGVSHNFPITPNGTLDVCLSGCDGTTTVDCTAQGAVGEGTPNGVAFGAPLPLLAANVPVCVVNRWRDPITGTANIQTGEMDLLVTLFSDVYFTSSGDVCPQCINGKCNLGRNSGKACTVEAELEVVESTASDKTFKLSRDCPPFGQPDGTLLIDLPLTTKMTDALTIDTCPTQKANECGAGGCGAACTGKACVAMIENPSAPGEMVCVDSKGGISQTCCNSATDVPCFAIDNGGEVRRQGLATVPQPALPDATFPKTHDGVLAAIFCEAATGVATIDRTTGLPGPAALILSGSNVWSQTPAP